MPEPSDSLATSERRLQTPAPPTPPRAIRGLLFDASGTLLRACPGAVLGVDIFPDAVRLLGVCRRRLLGDVPLRTALVTNWGHRVNRMLENLGIADCFDAVVCADDVHDAKPHAEIFHLACRLLGVPPRDCLHVGDSLFDDALGAQAAGLEALWIHRKADAILTLTERMMVSRLKGPHFVNLEDAHAYLACHFAATTPKSH
ncbi:MAG: HAD-IA family hydrolase [Silvanigrellales bacterium]|nr:HAD-IA family hydrolase [Silvanigrellales bacterium]